MQRADRFLVLGGLGLLFVLLVGVLIYTTFARPQGSITTPFALAGTNGETVERADFEGHPSLLYFGYTNCPEVCPTTMFDMEGWLQTLGPEAADLKAYFFTVDPERDTMDVMQPYVAAFSDRIVGVTGDPVEMQNAARSFVVTADQNPYGNGDYSMLHTTSVLMIGANGRLAGLIPYEATPEQAIARIRDRLL